MLCLLSGFELYSRWVPLLVDLPHSCFLVSSSNTPPQKSGEECCVTTLKTAVRRLTNPNRRSSILAGGPGVGSLCCSLLTHRLDHSLVYLYAAELEIFRVSATQPWEGAARLN